MWYPARITVAAIYEPVTLAEVKAQARIDATDDDALLTRLIATARDYVEKYTATRLATQSVEIKCDDFADMARLPEAPVQSISIVYTDVAGVDQTLLTDVYELRADGLEVSIVLKYGQVWPGIRPGSRITVTAVVGYVAAPETVRHAMLLFIADADRIREAHAAGERTNFDNALVNDRRGR